MSLKPLLVLALGLAAGCALKGDVRKVELQVEAARAERARADAERAAQLDSVRVLLAAVQQALAAQQAYLVQLRGDVRTDLLAVQQQLVQVQELTGQSQQRLTELRARIEERAQQPVPRSIPAPPQAWRLLLGPRETRRDPGRIGCTTSPCSSSAAAASPLPGWGSASSSASIRRMSGRPTRCSTSARPGRPRTRTPRLRCINRS